MTPGSAHGPGVVFQHLLRPRPAMPARTTPKSTRTQADSRAGAIAREQDKAIGAALAGGWVIVRAAEAIRAEGTDGMYSRGYIARKGRRAAYVKVFDYRRAVPDWKAARREAFTRAGYDFEKKVLELCAGRGLRGVNRLLASGVLRRARSVERYLVLEAARCDLRGVLTGLWCTGCEVPGEMDRA